MDKEEKERDQFERYFIVVFGPPASGKTTFANRLLSAYQHSHIHQQPQDCILISADCCEQFLRNHSIFDLEQLLAHPAGWKELSQFKLQRSLFNEQLWKKSRQFIKQHIALWLQRWRIVILEDDLLLRSQRKQMRQIVQYTNIKYVQLYSPCSFQECVDHLKQRSLQHSQQEQLPIEKLQECYDKFQIEDNPFCQVFTPTLSLSFALIQDWAKPVQIDHPEQRQKMTVTPQNAAKDEAEHQIRGFISEIISNEEERKKHCPKLSREEAAGWLGKIKRLYKSKKKSLEEFKAFLKEKTEAMI